MNGRKVKLIRKVMKDQGLPPKSFRSLYQQLKKQYKRGIKVV